MIEFTCWKKTYNTFGGSSLYAPVANLLTVSMHEFDFGPGVKEIDLTANLRSSGKPKKTLEELFDDFHKDLGSLPKVTYRRKQRRMEIEFLSERFTAEDDGAKAKETVKNLNLAAKEIAAAITLMQKRIKRDDPFDVVLFLERASETLQAGLPSKQAWHEVDVDGRRIEKGVLATKGPWDLLELDWDEYHVNAREILDDPYFWECTDDFAPHGNDTGADLLEAFKDWDKQNRRKSPLTFLDHLMRQWGIEPIDWLVTAPSATRSLREGDSITLDVCNEAAIALPFAVIKCRGRCPSNIAQYGLSALSRTSLLIKDSSLPSELKKEWTGKSRKMRTKLRSYLS